MSQEMPPSHMNVARENHPLHKKVQASKRLPTLKMTKPRNPTSQKYTKIMEHKSETHRRPWIHRSPKRGRSFFQHHLAAWLVPSTREPKNSQKTCEHHRTRLFIWCQSSPSRGFSWFFKIISENKRKTSVGIERHRRRDRSTGGSTGR